MNHSVETLNKALKDIGVTPKVHGCVLEFAFTPIDRSKPARQSRRKEYDGLRSLPFCSKEQVERLRILKVEVVADNHAAFEERPRTPAQQGESTS